MIFQPGQKVVCIDDIIPSGIMKFLTAVPVKGITYTIRGIAPGINPTGQDDIAVYLVGLHNPCSSAPPYRERGFRPERFAPLDEVPPATVEKEELVNA